jgi:hypothetical protein
MLSFESTEQLAAIESGDFSNGIPAFHSILVWSVTRVWRSPAAVTLLQVAAMVALLTLFVRRVVALGAPRSFAAAMAVLFAWLPAVGATTIALEVQVAHALAGIWLLVEIIALAPDPSTYLGKPWSQARLGGALALTWLLDHGGFVVVGVVAVVLVIWLRTDTRALAAPVGGALAVVFLIQGPVFALFDVDREVPPLGVAYAPEIAAVRHHHPGWFDEGDRALLESVARLEVWEDAYQCRDGAALLADRDFDATVIRRDPGAYRGLLIRGAVGNPLTVLGHRWCAAEVLFVPSQPLGVQFATYVYNVPPNDLGIERSTLWERGFNMTKAILVRVDRPDQLWLFWRPAIFVWPALVASVVLVVRRRSMAGPAAVFLAYLLLAFLTVREPAFRDVFPVYALAFLSLALWWRALGRPHGQ